jgi:hypothetical protein
MEQEYNRVDHFYLLIFVESNPSATVHRYLPNQKKKPWVSSEIYPKFPSRYRQ